MLLAAVIHWLIRHILLTARLIFSLSALAASLFAGSGAPVVRPSHDLASRFLRPHMLRAVPFVLSASEHSPALPFVHTPDEAFALSALTSTPLRRSLWLVASLVAIDSNERCHQRESLRC